MTSRNIIVCPFPCIPIELREIEICEHKGIGHPDSIADGVCEAASRELSLAYLREYGRVLHHNLDKGLLVAGKSEPRFGGGELVEPVKLLICGRATRPAGGFDVRQAAADAARRYLAQNIRLGAGNFEIGTEIKGGSGNLKEVFARNAAVPLANDTSFGCGFAPYSPLEQAVLGIAHRLRSDEFRTRFPCAGDDFKIMGHRANGATAFTLALAFIDRHVKSVSHYFALKEEIRTDLSRRLELPALLRLNTLDDPQARDENGLYLTVSGLSAEMGDDGQVGRGNRVSGLITPGRAMSLEAAAGKNPVSHVGKIYNVLATLIARALHDQLEEVEAASVQLLSAIGEPIDRPQVAAIELNTAQPVSTALKERAAAIAESWLERIDEVTGLILEQKVGLF